MMNFTREEIIKNLQKITGRNEIPDEIIEEFMDELRQDQVLNQKIESEPRRKGFSESDDEMERGDISPPSGDESSSLLEDEGDYSPEKYQKVFGVPRKPIQYDSETSKERYVSDEYSPEVKKQTRKKRRPRYERPLVVDDHYSPPQRRRKRPSTSYGRRKRNLSSSPSSSTSSSVRVARRKPLQEPFQMVIRKRPTTSYGRPQNRTKRRDFLKKKKKYKRKTDPVARFHQFNSCWKGDKFLKGSRTDRKKLRYRVRQEMLEIQTQVE